MDYIRDNCILTNDNTLEPLYTLPNFPVSMSCVPLDFHEYKYIDMIFEICKNTGMIQLKHIPDINDIYITPHNTSYGKIWDQLYDKFIYVIHEFLITESNITLLEIGGGFLKLASKLLQNNNKITKYIVYEKNMSTKYINDERISIIDEYFVNTTQITSEIDVVIHSHVLEHVWNPCEFIEAISRHMKNNKYHFFIVPNLQETFKNKYTNAINFEHNFFITEPYIDIILHNNNFDIIKKEYYLDHSIIYITKYIEREKQKQNFPNMYNEYYSMALSYYNYHIDLIAVINNKISVFDGDIYLYGAHIFSQFLISFGLDTSKIKGILDNSEEKKSKKLYGTELIVYSPNIISNTTNVCVILKAASYQREITEQLLNVNENIVIIS